MSEDLTSQRLNYQIAKDEALMHVIGSNTLNIKLRFSIMYKQ